MPYNASEMQYQFTLVGLTAFNGNYCYDVEKKWADKGQHDPWC